MGLEDAAVAENAAAGEFAERGFVTTTGRHGHELGAHRFVVADDLRSRLLRGRDDACRRVAL